MANVKSLTEGTPWKLILSFSVPIMVGQIFQLLYSIIDTKVVGAFLGESALAAVGSVSTLYNLISYFGNGLTMGFAIILAMYFGAKEMDKLRHTFGMTILLNLITVCVVMAGVLIFLNPILQLIHVPEEQFLMARSYIRVLVVGLFITYLYHMCANALRALGDSITPLMFLILASLCNVGLDYLFVFQLHWGVAGAAYATVLAQLISVVLCFIRIYRKFPLLHVQKQDFRPEKGLILEMYKSGLSMGLMNSLVGFGTVTLQSAINLLGTSIIVAHVAARKVCEILFMPMVGVGFAMATYAGQNYGAKRIDRIRTGLKSAMMMGIIWSAIAIGLMFTVSRQLVSFLASTENPEVIYWGSTYLKFNVVFLFVCFTVGVLRNSMQGYGERIVPVISSGIELVGKLVFALALVPILGYWGVILTEPVVWIVMDIPLIVKTVRFLQKNA